MAYKHISAARKIASVAFTSVLACTLAFPASALAIDDYIVDAGEWKAGGTPDNGEGWAYDGADTITLDNYDGAYIQTFGDTIIQLEGDNFVGGGIVTTDGDLTVKGDNGAYGTDKPSITLTYYYEEPQEGDIVLQDGIYSQHWLTDDECDLAVEDVNIYVNLEEAYIGA